MYGAVRDFLYTKQQKVTDEFAQVLEGKDDLPVGESTERAQLWLSSKVKSCLGAFNQTSVYSGDCRKFVVTSYILAPFRTMSLEFLR